jgi:hypothetical protein
MPDKLVGTCTGYAFYDKGKGGMLHGAQVSYGGKFFEKITLVVFNNLR